MKFDVGIFRKLMVTGRNNKSARVCRLSYDGIKHSICLGEEHLKLLSAHSTV